MRRGLGTGTAFGTGDWHVRFSWVVTIALLLSLPVLAVLQYRWIGRVSDAEREQLQASVRNAAEQFTADFSSTIRTAITEGTSPLRAVYQMVPGPANDLELKRWNQKSRTFEPAPWPADLAAIRARVEANEHLPGPPEELLEDTDLSVLAVPRFDPGRGGRGGREFGPGSFGSGFAPAARGPGGRGPGEHGPGEHRPGPGFPGPSPDRHAGPPHDGFDLPSISFAQLDLDYMRRVVVPQLASKYFPQTQNYRLVILQSRTGRVIYGPPGLENIEREPPPDLAMPLLGRPAPPDGPGGRPSSPGEGRGPWELWVTARSGSLEAAIAQARRRNLTLSFAALALLGSAMLVLTVSAQRARVLAKRQMEFVAGVSHELRTPLAVIRAAGENLSAGVASSETQVKRYGAMIEKEGRRLTGMVETLLDFGALESGRMALDPKAVDAAQVIRDAVASCKQEVEEAGCVVEEAIAPDVPWVEADAQALFLCVRNLLSNAVRYGASGKWVQISARADGDAVLVSVADRGPGIDPADLPHLFERFYRGSEGKASQTRGAGVGLSLVRQLIRAQQGDIIAESTPGNGARFTLRIPAASISPSRDSAT